MFLKLASAAVLRSSTKAEGGSREVELGEGYGMCRCRWQTWPRRLGHRVIKTEAHFCSHSGEGYGTLFLCVCVVSNIYSSGYSKSSVEEHF